MVFWFVYSWCCFVEPDGSRRGQFSNYRSGMCIFALASKVAVPKPHHLLPHLNSDWFYLSGTSLSMLSWKKRPLNGCSGSSSSRSRGETSGGVLSPWTWWCNDTKTLADYAMMMMMMMMSTSSSFSSTVCCGWQGTYQPLSGQPYSLPTYSLPAALPVQPIHSQLKYSAPPFKPASQLVVSPTTLQVGLSLLA